MSRIRPVLLASYFICMQVASSQTTCAQANSERLPPYLQAIGRDYSCVWKYYDIGSAECPITQIGGVLDYAAPGVTSACSLKVNIIVTNPPDRSDHKPELSERLLSRLVKDIFPHWTEGGGAIRRYLEQATTDGEASLVVADGTTISLRRNQPADIDDLYVDVEFSGPSVCSDSSK